MPELPELSYVRPRDLAEALDASARPQACIYAGGTDLLIALMARRSTVGSVRELVDIKDLEEAAGLDDGGDHIRVGSLVTAADLAASPLVGVATPALARAAQLTSAPALRSRGTVGGNIVTSHPAGDVTTALLALGATVELVDADGVRDIGLSEFLQTKPAAGCLLLAVKVAKRPKSRFEKFAMRTGFGRSLVAVGVSTNEEGVRVAVGGLGERPLRARRIERAIETGSAIEEALAEESRSLTDGLAGDAIATGGYRIRIAGVLIERALSDLGMR